MRTEGSFEERVLGHSVSVADHPLGAYPMVAEATRSHVFAGEASLAEFWASLPGFPTPNSLFGDRPRCLTMERASARGDERSLLARALAPTHAVFRTAEVETSDLPDSYPTTRGIVQDGVRADVLGEQPVYKFPREDGSLRTLSEVGTKPFYAERSSGMYIVRPKIGTDPIEPPSQFLTLWALLFGLSELARYYPDTWVSALDADTSIAAVTLEHGLDLALARAPSLIGDALRGPVDALMAEELHRRREDSADTEGAEGGDDTADEAGQ